jgi:hypothetical protein
VSAAAIPHDGQQFGAGAFEEKPCSGHASHGTRRHAHREIRSASMSTISINSTPKRMPRERYVVPHVRAPLGPPEALAVDVRQRGSARRQPPAAGSLPHRKKLAIFERPS